MSTNAPADQTLTTQEILSEFFKRHFGRPPESITPLSSDGSSRRYFRLHDGGQSVIGAFGPDPKENAAFLSFAQSFKQSKLNVPHIYAHDLDRHIYLEEDLGDVTLFSLIQKNRTRNNLDAQAISIYEKTINELPRFQIAAAKMIDYKFCYPRGSFDRQSMIWDFNYFKYYFLRLAQIPFHEQSLEDDFNRLADFLLQSPNDYFLYRDFQSRNIMVRNNEPWFIDFQGGRKGALQYDIASLLFDAKADLPFDLRERWLNLYVDAASKLAPINPVNFEKFYWGYVLIRIMQAMGAYGLRGFYERKTHFLQSIPYAIRNLEHILRENRLPEGLRELPEVLYRLVGSSYLRQFGQVHLKLTVSVQSFSYKQGVPMDNRGHGGGFIFDCRSLPNPGRHEKYAQLTGLDQPVVDFLSNEPAVKDFLGNVVGIIEQAVKNYQSRNFTDLSIAFGCTGGRHRSVYCAQKLADHLKNNFPIEIELRHKNLEK